MDAKRYLVPVPFSGLPLPGRNNPIIAVLSGEALLINARMSGAGCALEAPGIPGLANIVCAYASRLAEALEEEAGVEIRVEAQRRLDSYPRSSLVALLSLSILEAYEKEAGYRFTAEEKLEYSSILDSAVGYKGWQASMLHALRESSLRGTPLVYRAGEGTVELPDVVRARALECRPVSYESLALDEHVVDAVTHLAGMVTLGIADSVRLESMERLEEYWRLEDGLWYSLWGVLPRRHAKLIPDLGGVCVAKASYRGSKDSQDRWKPPIR